MLSHMFPELKGDPTVVPHDAASDMKVCGRAGATGTAQVGVRQGCPLSPTLFGVFFNDLHSQLQSDCPSAELSVGANAFPAYSTPMTLHCSRHLHRDCSSCWTPCSRSEQQMASPSASPNKSLWSLVGAIMIVLGRWLVNI